MQIHNIHPAYEVCNFTVMVLFYKKGQIMTEFYKIGKTAVSVSDFHHEVIELWSMVKRSMPDTELAAITLDHHTDVVQAFRGTKEVCHGAWQHPELVRQTIAELRHDEHIDWAVKTGVLTKAFVISHVDMTPAADNRITVLHDKNFPDELTQLNEPEIFRPFAGKVLDDRFLTPLIGNTLPKNFILDIDCDNFMCRSALEPVQYSLWHRLIKNACAISISKESDYVRLLRLKGENLSADDIVDHLLELFRELLA